MIKPARGPRDLSLSLSPRVRTKYLKIPHSGKASAYHLHTVRVTQATEVESGARCLVAMARGRCRCL